MDVSKMIYVSSADAVAVVSALLIMGILLAPLAKREGELQDGDWFRIRLSFLLPLFVSPFVALAYRENFGALRLLFHVGATAYPVWGLALHWIVHRRGTTHAWHRHLSVAVTVATLLLVPLAAWMVFAEPYRLEVTKTVVETDARSDDPVRVVMLADVQTDRFGPWEERVLREVNRLDADVVVLPGDLLQTWPERYGIEIERARDFLRRIEAKHGVFLVEGDADAWAADYKTSGVTVLRNDVAQLRIRGRQVALAGTQNDWESPAVAETIQRLESDGAELKLLLSHRPMTATRAQRPNTSVDLVLAGHTHGGQVTFPLFGPLITLSAAPREVCAGGLHTLGGRQIYVSRGIGMERHDAPRIRLGARPEIAVLEIQ